MRTTNNYWRRAMCIIAVICVVITGIWFSQMRTGFISDVHSSGEEKKSISLQSMVSLDNIRIKQDKRDTKVFSSFLLLVNVWQMYNIADCRYLYRKNRNTESRENIISYIHHKDGPK